MTLEELSKLLPGMVVSRLRAVDPPEDFSSPCIVYQGYLAKGGYASVQIDGARVYLHRYVLAKVKGLSPEEDADHLCYVRACCQSDHLEAVTHSENVLRSYEHREDYCSRGHGRTDENTDEDERGKPICVQCEIEEEAIRA